MNWYWVRERGERMEEESGEGCRELLFFGRGNVGGDSNENIDH